MESYPNVLAIDDDSAFLANLKFAFEGSFNIIASTSLPMTEEILKTQGISAIILDFDFGLAENGHVFLENIRKIGCDQPVIVVSGALTFEMAAGFLKKRVFGFLEKPVQLSELKRLLVNAVGSNGQTNETNLDFQIKYPTREVILDGKAVTLTPTEFEILTFFIKNRKRQIKRTEIISQIWPNSQVSRHTFDTHLINLKKKLPPFDKKLTCIYGTGYCYDT